MSSNLSLTFSRPALLNNKIRLHIMLTKTIENIKSEFKNIKFLEKKELQQVTIAVLIAGLISSIGFSSIDILLNFVIQKLLFV